MDNPINFGGPGGAVWPWLTAATILVVFAGLRSVFQVFRIGWKDWKKRRWLDRERNARKEDV